MLKSMGIIETGTTKSKRKYCPGGNNSWPLCLLHSPANGNLPNFSLPICLFRCCMFAFCSLLPFLRPVLASKLSIWQLFFPFPIFTWFLFTKMNSLNYSLNVLLKSLKNYHQFFWPLLCIHYFFIFLGYVKLKFQSMVYVLFQKLFLERNSVYFSMLT